MDRARAVKGALYSLWIAGILALFALHFAHLLADFPNYSPWMDYSKYTDEGWYGSAAVRYCLTGHWFLRGDFNPAAALPVWPLLLAVVFHFTGVSLGAARGLALAVFGINLVLSCAIIRSQAPRWAALLAVTVLVTNPFLYAFSRVAILEPLLMCFILVSWLIALRLRPELSAAQSARFAIIGLLLCLAVLTKTTAVFILPSTLLLIAFAYRFRLRDSVCALAITGAAALVPWCAWYFLFIRPRYRVDYRYLFEANQWPQPATPEGWLGAFWYAFHGGLWISPALCITAAVLVPAALLPLVRRPSHSADGRGAIRRNPVLLASLLLSAGYMFFTGLHNSPQPRYYQTVAYPLAFILSLTAHNLVSKTRQLLLRVVGAVGVVVLAGICVAGTVRIAGYVEHSEYTWLKAAEGVTRYIDNHPAPSRLLLSISGANISLMTHLPTICDDYGTWDLPYRIHTYRPSWYAVWNEVDPDTLTDLETQYSLRRVAAFPAFDDPDRNLLILYRLEPLPSSRQKYRAAEERAENAGK
jgi:4-amino-4-deoxy-L-arabinose transferase-like glycosyltransferase